MTKSLLILSVIVLFAIPACLAVDYTVTNNATATPGGAKFNSAIGVDYSRRTLAAATTFIWRIFQQNNPADRKNINRVDLFIEDIAGVAFASGNRIHVSARYINGYNGDVRREITGVLYHEMTHVWQWNGNGQSGIGGLIEGIADFVRLKAGLAPAHWRQPGQGERWDQGYDVTARFLDYCNDLGGGNFVANLNKRMRNGYNVNFFRELLGKSVDELWRDYKARYNRS